MKIKSRERKQVTEITNYPMKIIDAQYQMEQWEEVKRMENIVSSPK
jgi:hypothetical protein